MGNPLFRIVVEYEGRVWKSLPEEMNMEEFELVRDVILNIPTAPQFTITCKEGGITVFNRDVLLRTVVTLEKLDDIP